jgi:hypothetical protein
VVPELILAVSSQGSQSTIWIIGGEALTDFRRRAAICALVLQCLAIPKAEESTFADGEPGDVDA